MKEKEDNSLAVSIKISVDDEITEANIIEIVDMIREEFPDIEIKIEKRISNVSALAPETVEILIGIAIGIGIEVAGNLAYDALRELMSRLKKYLEERKKRKKQ